MELYTPALELGLRGATHALRVLSSYYIGRAPKEAHTPSAPRISFLLELEASNRTDFDAIVSAMKSYTTLKKISTKTVYYEKSWSILKSVNPKK